MGDNTNNISRVFDKIIPFTFVNAILICLFLAVLFWNRFENKNSTPMNLPVIDGKININQEETQSIARLPSIGVTLANEIVAYRKNTSLNQTNKLPFEKPIDLRKVKGIGPKKQKTITPWIKFK